MSLEFNVVQRYMSRRILTAIALLAAVCQSQTAPKSPVSPELNRRIERQVRTTLQAPPYVKIEATDRQPDPNFAGYDDLTITLSADGRSQKVKFLISKDDQTMYSMTKFDLSKDPYEATMAKIDTTGRPVRGNPNAKVTVIVFDDFQCPFCSRMHSTVTNSLKTYGDKVRVIYKDFPLSDIHPWANHAAIDSQCLASQSSGAFWDFADFVHANGGQINGQKRTNEGQFQEIDRIADDMGKRHSLDQSKLDACLKEQPTKNLDASVAEAEKLGLNATPAVFVNGLKLEGAVPEAEFEAVLDQALKDVGVAPPNHQAPAAKPDAAPAAPTAPSGN